MIITSTHLKLAGATVLLAVAGLGVSAYVHQRVLQAKSDATQAAQQQVQKQLADQKAQMEADFDARLKARDAEYQASLQSVERRFQSTTTPEELAALASKLMSLKEPIRVVTPPPTESNPNPTPIAEIPALPDAPQVKAYLQTCEECKLSLWKTQADLSDVQAQRAAEAKLAQQQIDSLKSQRDAAVTAAKGGPWLKRLGKQLKVIGCATGGAAIGGAGKGGEGAAIGAFGGAVVCSLF